MEIDQTKSATTEDQMEMVMTMMMDKFPELYGPNYNDVVDDQHPSPTNYLPSTTTPTNNPFTNTTAANINPYFLDNPPPAPNNISFAKTHSYYPSNSSQTQDHVPPPIDFLDPKTNTKKSTASMAAMREMIFWIAAMQPIHIDPESVKPPKRRNVKISKDPQSVAARRRRERISERIRILQRLVPGGTKMDTASMLDEAIHYVKFLKTQVQSLERAQVTNGNNTSTSGSNTKGFAASCCSSSAGGVGFPVAMSTVSYLPGLGRGYHCQANSGSFGDD